MQWMIYCDNPTSFSLIIILHDHTFIFIQTRYNTVGIAKLHNDGHMINNRLGAY